MTDDEEPTPEMLEQMMDKVESMIIKGGRNSRMKFRYAVQNMRMGIYPNVPKIEWEDEEE